MHLSSIHLSSFKSFVDSTRIDFPSQLSAVVGPNGCGKSNIIDAVRWVLGESSAKTLRGSLISDVVFSGSSSRPESNFASVELSFQDTLGKLKGDFARYNEISVSRNVNTEGLSHYAINGIRCRRKDIVDAFLGTGLGARSYSIIQQGTISRLVESKPEELRQYLEEAAGISHYKERRRETASRLHATKENLERLRDLCEEKEKIVRRLQTQAHNATAYKVFEQERQQLTEQWLAIQWHALEEKLQGIGKKQQTAENRIEEKRAKLHKLEAAHETSRQKYSEFQEEHQQANKALYECKVAISRLEFETKALQEKLANLQQEKENRNKRKQTLQSRQSHDTARMQDIQKTQTHQEKELAQLNAQLREKEKNYVQTEKDYRQLQQEWESFQAKNYDQRTLSEVEQVKIQQLEKRIRDAKHELDGIKPIDNSTISAHKKQDKEQHKNLQQLEKKLTQQQKAGQRAKKLLVQAEYQSKEKLEKLHELHKKLQVSEGRAASLQTLLDSKMHDGYTSTASFSKKHALKRWIEQVQVRQGWEYAVESVLPELARILVASDTHILQQTHIPAGAAIVIANGNQKTDTENNVYSCQQIIDGPVPAWMESVFFADDHTQALNFLPQLQAHQRIVCKDGSCFGCNWLATHPQQKHDALLSVQRRLHEQQKIGAGLEQEISRVKKDAQDCNTAIDSLRSAYEQQQQQQLELERSVINTKNDLDKLNGKIDQLNNEQQQKQQQRKRLEATLKTTTSELSTTRNSWSKSLASLRYDDQEKQKIADRRRFVSQQLNMARSEWQTLQKNVGEKRIKQQQTLSEHQHLATTLQNYHKELREIDSDIAQLQQQLSSPDNQPSILQTTLQQQLDTQIVLEKDVKKRLDQVSRQDSTLKKSADEQKKQRELIAQRQEAVNALQIQKTEITTKQQALLEQLADKNPQEIYQSLPARADAVGWKYKIEQVEKKVRVLGEINHAAIKDFEHESENKKHLDEQRQEIEKAVTTLEKTINTLDTATKDEFRETFDTVNNNLQALFPRLLGGGSCKLQMTSNDLLHTGITIIARPPGKRNTSISMLSGGEKAMTAIALVFAIFQLNPSPFCMLDEVDAPLDDINTNRFIQLVKEMSADVQFILVTHSKITMEQVHQLIGITMHEPGVSRIVSVDMEKTLESL